MKCSQCGSVKLVAVGFPMTSYDGSASLSADLEVYLCVKCGHYELFSTKIAQSYIADYKNALRFIKEAECDIKKLQKCLSELEDHSYEKKLQSEIDAIKAQIEKLGENITLKQQTEMQTKISELNRELFNVPSKMRTVKDEIDRLERELKNKKEYIVSHDNPL